MHKYPFQKYSNNHEYPKKNIYRYAMFLGRKKKKHQFGLIHNSVKELAPRAKLHHQVDLREESSLVKNMGLPE